MCFNASQIIRRKITLLRFFQNCDSQRMPASCLQGCSYAKQLGRILCGDIRNDRLTNRQCTGFIKHDRIDTACGFQCFPAFHKNTKLRGFAGSDHDCGWCRKP